ncbi:MAG TPA: immunoglobulin domain-containing protein [Pyrinomonadaceae bacterium]|nr:immunoglobulin domain-containing protein [Pyrinomonadaceae bacterium]
MVYARFRTTTKSEWRRLTLRRSILGLIVIAGLTVAALAWPLLTQASSERSLNTRGERLERGFRLRERAPAASVSRTPLHAMMFASITVDRTDDTAAASACTAAANDCSLRGAVSFADANPGTTIILPAGTYQLNIAGGAGEGFSGNNAIGDLDITANNTTISGAGASTTIIQQTQPNDRVIEVNPFLDPNFTTTISGVTISGGHETTGVGGGGIISGSVDNSLTITNCVFSGNSATGAGTLGGGGISHAGGSLTITGSTFNNNSTSASGGAIGYSAGDPLGRTPSSGALSISGSTFSSNTATSAAGGGGGLDLFDFNLSASTYSVDSSTFSSNHATNGSGGAIIVESGPLSVNTSALTGNSALNAGGAVLSAGSATSVTYSRIVGNTAAVGSALFKSGTTFSADDNWWGSNTGPSGTNLGGGITVASYLQLRISASPNEVCSGQTSALSADIKQRNTGGALTTELNGLPTFAAVFNATLGTISGATNFVDGAASATYTAGGTSGSGSADVTADNQTVTANITISTNDTTNPGNQVVCQGGTATFTTTASGPGTISFVWKKGATVLNNGDLGGRVTITSGGSTSTLSISNAQLTDSDTYTVEATGTCNTTSESATLTVNPTTTATDPTDQTVCQGTNANFSTTAAGADLHYAWTLDGSPFDGDNSNISVPTGSLAPGAHTIGLTVTGSCGTVNQSATLTVQPSTTATDPADQTVCQGTSASFSTTATGANLHYAWTVDGSAFGGDTSSINVPTGSLSVGSHTVGLTVTGSCGTVTQSATLTVQANTATSKPADQTVCQGTDAHFSTTASGTGPFHYAWTVDGSPFNGDSSSITVPTGSLSVGNHSITVTTSGACGTATQSATLTVTSPTPVINLSQTSATMWPPNHQYQTFHVSDFVSSATAGCDSNTNVTSSVVIQKVSSDEPEDNPTGGDGNTLNDIVIAPDCKSAQLRSERDGNLNGRVYTITFKVTDSFGNSATATVKVYVPKSPNNAAVDNGAAAGYTVNSNCP